MKTNYIVKQENAGQRLDNFVLSNCPDLSRSHIKTLIENGKILLNEKIVKSGEKIANLGDSAISELADEPHLHFEIMINGVSLNPLDYISDEAKKTSLGISEENDA